MKKALAIICTAIECFLFLWLVVGLWACAVKIREMERWHNERLESIQTFDLPEHKLNALVMACHMLQQDVDALRVRVVDLEEFLGMDEAVDRSEEELCEEQKDKCEAAADRFHPINELRVKVDALDARVRDLETTGK